MPVSDALEIFNSNGPEDVYEIHGFCVQALNLGEGVTLPATALLGIFGSCRLVLRIAERSASVTYGDKYWAFCPKSQVLRWLPCSIHPRNHICPNFHMVVQIA